MKFGTLLKKELGEMFSKQAIIGMVFTVGLLILMGQLMNGIMSESFDSLSSITVCNLDDTEFTNDILKRITDDKIANIDLVQINGEDYAAELERLDVKNLIVIPQGYADSILIDKKPAEIRFISTLSTGGFISSVEGVSASDAVKYINKASQDEIMLKSYGISNEEIARIKDPTQIVEFTVNNGKTAEVSPSALTAILMVQSLIAPMIIFFLLLMATQMIMTAISNEKIDKTLETLLSTPVSRITVLGAKMLAAVISALANALATMIGFVFYILGMAGMMGNITESFSSSSAAESVNAAEIVGEIGGVTQAMTDLGLSMSISSYFLFALQLFFTLAIGLSVALILGAMATDIKSVQVLVLPIMVAVMVPWFITMFSDINTLSMPFRVIMFIIPFTHTYTALTNLMNGDMLMFWAGLAYQIVFFVVCMYLAVKMFTTDKLFTMSYSVDASKAKKKKITGLKTKKA